MPRSKATPSTPTIRILLTEDVGADAELEVRELKRAGLRLVHRVVDSESSFTAALREFAPDVILSDFTMPGFDGMAALALARELSPEVPFIFVSGTIGEEYAIRALKNGATDYVLKTNLVRLPAAVERALVEARERREQRRTEVELDLARERLTSIFNSLPDMLWSVDAASGRELYISPAAMEIHGRAPEEFLADSKLWIDVIHPEDRPAVMAAWEKVPHGGSFDVEYRIRRADGQERWINDRGRLIKGTDGDDRIDGLARDITDRVRQRERIERLSRIRDMLGALSSAIVRTRERKPLFEEFCRIAVTRGGFVLARIVELGADGTARIAATTESDATLFQGMVDDYNRDAESSQTLLATALRSGEPVISNDIAGDPRVPNRAALSSAGNYALALLPMIVEGRVAGAVALRAREAGFFDREELGLLFEMVSNISFALELLGKQDRITYLALYDTLTGLPNRTLFHERLTQASDRARRTKETLALVLIDLERFKGINDTFGQHTGDRVLQTVAERLKASAADPGHVARLGSNLFAVIMGGIDSAEEAARRIEQTAGSIFVAPLEIDGREVRLATKAGVAVFPEDGGDADALFRNAEATLKRAKETGERYLFYAPDINARVAEQVDLEHRLRKAVEQGELFLHFQPKLDLGSRSIVGLEALMRWNGADGKPVSPAKFVPVLEQTGLILEAGRQAIARASAAYRDWRSRGLQAPRIAVNVSALQLRRRSFVEDVSSAIGWRAEEAGGIDLEITESLLMSEVDESIRKLGALRERGVRIALDDFGTGYSSLAYLSKLPLDTLKIDRGFVHGMTANAGDTTIVSTIISLAQALRLKVVAEGVETEEQAQLLRLLRCDQVRAICSAGRCWRQTSRSC